MGGLYPCKELVEAILDPAVNANPKILDLGCGSGIWYALLEAYAELNAEIRQGKRDGSLYT